MAQADRHLNFRAPGCRQLTTFILLKWAARVKYAGNAPAAFVIPHEDCRSLGSELCLTCHEIIYSANKQCSPYKLHCLLAL